MKEMKTTRIVFMISTVGAFVRPPLSEPINQPLAFNPLLIQNINLNSTNKLPAIASTDPSGSLSSHRKFLEFPRSKYVDKTLFISQALGLGSNISRPTSVKRPSILITRPRGFGKTLALSSLYFFCDYSFNNVTGLFSGLDIMSNASADRVAIREKYMSKFSVIWIDFGTVKYETIEQNFKEIKRIISNIFRGYHYLLESGKLSPLARNRFKKLAGESEEYSSVKNSIQFLGECIREYSNRVPIVFIDNYDVPFHTAYKYGYYKEIEAFMWSFYYQTIQENRYVHMVFLTGVTQIHDTSFYILENMAVDTILDNTFSNKFGFTKDEVKELLQRSSSNIQLETLQHRYGGYLCGQYQLFHPSFVANEIFSHKSCALAGSQDCGKVILEHGLYPLLTIQTLVDGRSVEKHLAKHIHFSDLKTREISYWSYLLHLGYVTAERISIEYPSSKFRLNIPNLEVGQKIESIIKEAAEKIPDYKKFTDQLILGDYAHAKYFVYNYTRDAGNYFWAGDQGGFSSKLRGYVLLMLRGVQNRFGTAMVEFVDGDVIMMAPGREEASPVTVFLPKRQIGSLVEAQRIIHEEFEGITRCFNVGPRSIRIKNQFVILVGGKTVYIYAGSDILVCTDPLEKKQQQVKSGIVSSILDFWKPKH